MNIRVVFPKESAINLKSSNEQRTINKNITKWINKITDSNSLLEYLLEDEMARRFLGQVDYNNKRVLTLLTDNDVQFCRIQKELDILPTYYDIDYNKEMVVNYDIHKKHKPPTIYKIKDKEEWVKARAEFIGKRFKYCANKMMEEEKAILYFYANNVNYCRSQLNLQYIGNGKLYIEVDIYSGIASIYYGGVAITEAILTQVLNSYQ